MKHLILLLFVPIFLKAQYITTDKTIFFDKPNGEAIYYVNPKVFINAPIGDSSFLRSKLVWKNVFPKNAFYLKSSLKKFVLIKNSILYDESKKPIGKTLKNIKVSDWIDTTLEGNEYIEFYYDGFAKKQTIKKLAYSDFSKNKNLGFSTQDQNYFVLLGDSTSDTERFYSVETSYKIIKNNDEGKNGFMLLKKRIEKIDESPAEFNPEEYPKITITAYPNIYKKDSIVFVRQGTHEIELRKQNEKFKFWEAKTHGCCLGPERYELVHFPSNKEIFKCNDGYYVLRFGGIEDFILLGYNFSRPEIEKDYYLGELNYTINGEKNGKVFFRCKVNKLDSNFYVDEKIIDFIKIDTTDKVFDWYENSKSIRYDYWSEIYRGAVTFPVADNKFKSVYEATGIGVEVIFKAKVFGQLKTKKIKIIFDKGEVKDKEIFIDFEAD
jgi:hypothetical protein